MSTTITLKLNSNEKEIECLLHYISENTYTGLSTSELIRYIIKDEMEGNDCFLATIGEQYIRGFENRKKNLPICFADDAPELKWLKEEIEKSDGCLRTEIRNMIRRRVSIVEGNEFVLNRKEIERYRLSSLQKKSRARSTKKPILSDAGNKNIVEHEKSILEPNKAVTNEITKKSLQDSVENDKPTDKSTTSNMDLLSFASSMVMGGFQ